MRGSTPQVPAALELLGAKRVRAAPILAGALVVLSAFLPAPRAGCYTGDPSAVDLDPCVEPLRAIRDDATDARKRDPQGDASDCCLWALSLSGTPAPSCPERRSWPPV